MFLFRHFIILTYIFFLGTQWNSVNAQHFYTKNITIKDGLPSNRIYDIYKDSRGYIWIGTEAGVCRFDGVNYKIYTKSDGLAGNRIWSIAEDTLGNLWFACYGNGLSMFDGSKFKNLYVRDGLVNENVRKIEYSKKHKGLLIGTSNGFSFYKDSSFVSFKDTINKNVPYVQVTSFVEADSLIYLLTFHSNKYFIEFKPTKRTFKYLDKHHRFNNSTGTSTIGFITSKKDTIIGNGLYGIRIFTKDSIIDNNSVGQLFEIVEGKSDDLWMASWSDGVSLESHKGGIYRYTNNREEYFNNKLGIVTQECWCLLYDEEEDLLWIGTLDKGIYKFPLTGVEFSPATILNQSKPEINDFFIDSKGNTWTSIGDKILINGKPNINLSYQRFTNVYDEFCKSYYRFLLDKKGGYNKYQKLKDMGITKLNPYFRDNSILPDGSLYNPNEYRNLINKKIKNFYRFFEDLDGNIWIGSDIGLFSYNPRQNSLQHHSLIGYCKILDISHEYVFILTHYQLYFYSLLDDNNAGWVDVRKNPTWSSNLGYIKDKDCFWLFCNTDGLIKYKNKKFIRFPYLTKQIDIEFNALCKDSSGHLIAGTNTGTIYILDHSNDSIKVSYSITEKEGIIGSEISWVLTDMNNRLWFATNSGLGMLNLEKLYKENKVELLFYNQENGFNDNSTYKAVLDRTGRIKAISKDNIITINTDILAKSRNKSNIVLDRIDVNFKECDWDGAGQVNKWIGLPVGSFSLPHSSNTISFYFHLLHYLDPSNVRYSYKLEGIQSSWSPYTTESKVILTNLSPDKYRLVIRGMVISNPNNVSELEINFTIRPPWWGNWWFYGGLVISSFVLVYLIFKNRLKLANEKSRIDQRVSELKLEALKAQMNPHFIFNAFTSIQLYILQNDTKNALDYMGRFAKLIRMTLDNSTKKKIQLSEELSFLENYLFLEQRRLSNVNYTFVVPPDIDTDEILIPPMLIQPLIENSIMHGIRHLEGEGKILVEFKKENDHQLRCIVEDNGIGRVKSKEIYSNQQKTHESRSTEITEERIKLLNSSSSDANIQLLYTDLCENGKSTGTIVELLISL